MADSYFSFSTDTGEIDPLDFLLLLVIGSLILLAFVLFVTLVTVHKVDKYRLKLMMKCHLATLSKANPEAKPS